MSRLVVPPFVFPLVQLLLGLAGPGPATAQVPDWADAQGAGHPGARSGGQAVACDAMGRFTVVGYFTEAAQFEQYRVISSGQEDVFLAQYDALGHVLWATRAGGNGDDGATSVVTDAANNVYVTGRFQGRAAFGATVLTSAGGDDLFLAKYTALGSLLWVRQVGASGADDGQAVAVDSTGNVYVGGSFQGTVTVGSTTVSSPGRAGLLLKYDPDGQVCWARSLPDSRVAGVATDGQGSVYVVGALTAAGSLLAKYNAAGTRQWLSAGTGPAAGEGQGVITDAQGNVYVTGAFRNTLAVSPTARVSSQGGADGFLAKFTPQGSGLWVRGLGGSGDDQGHGLALGPTGFIGVTGYVQGPATSGNATISSSNSCHCPEVFVAGYDAQGNCHWVRSAATEWTSVGTGLAFDASGGASVAGTYQGRATFGNHPALTSPFPAAFAARLDTTFPDLVVSTVQDIHGSYHDVTVTGTGVATLTGPLQVTGTVRVQGGGQFRTGCQPVTGPGAFIVAAAAELSIGHADGLATTGNQGAIQVTGSRTFSPDAGYTYAGTGPQQTGSGLPAQVRLLVLDNAAGLTLTQPLRLVQGLRLIHGDLALAGQALTLLSDANGTAQVDNADGVVQGVVTVQRYLDPSLNAGLGYRHLSAPVQATSVADLATATFTPVTNPVYNTAPAPQTIQPQPTVFGYDETRLSTATNSLADFDKGYCSPASNAAPLEVLRGYTVLLAGNQTVDFVGELNNGPYTATLTRGPQADAGWHLLGNPYPSTLDWSRVVVPAGLADAVYVFQSSGPYTGQYRSYLNGIGNPLIALGQGFLVRPIVPNSSVQLLLTNAARSADFASAPVVNRWVADTRPLVQLSLNSTATGASDETTVYFQAGATAGVDPHYDATKLPGNRATSVSLSSLTPTGEALAINGCPALATAGAIALRVQVTQPGFYRMVVVRLSHLTGVTGFLHDALTGDSLPLTSTTAYSFQVPQAGTLDQRFSLRFEPTTAVTRHGH